MEETVETYKYVCPLCGKGYHESRKFNGHRMTCGKAKKPKTAPSEPSPDTPDSTPEKPKKSTKKSLSLAEDIKWMYNQMGGRAELLVKARADSKFYKTCMELMLRSEQRIDELKAGKVEAPKGNTIFVLKGLQDQDVKELIATPDAMVRQFRAAVMPDRGEFVEEEFEESE